MDQPRRTSPWTVGIELLGLTGAASGLVLAIAVGDIQAIVQIGVAVVVLAVRTIGWWFRTYTVTDSHLTLDEGVFQRRHRVVPFGRLQQVDVSQGLLPRIAGVAAVRFETAGEGGATAISLRLLDRRDADALRAFALDRRDRVVASGRVRDGAVAVPASAAAWPVIGRMAVPLVALSAGRLFLAGCTEVSAVIIGIAVLAPAGALIAADVAFDGADGLGDVGAVLLLVPAISVGVAVLAGIGAMLSSWGYRLTAIGDDLHLRCGLVQVSEQTIPRQRVQRVTVVDNPLRRSLGLVAVLLHSAAPASQQEGRGNDLRIPLVRRADLPSLLAAVAGPAWVLPPLQARSPAARRRAVVRRCLLLVAVLAPTIVGVPLAALGVPWGRMAHRRAGLGSTDALVALASGVLHHRTDLVPRARIQSARLSSSPFQRRLGLATLWVDVAGTRLQGAFTRSPHLHDLDVADAEAAMGALPTMAR